jgi:non-heme chloroperoxidase
MSAEGADVTLHAVDLNHLDMGEGPPIVFLHGWAMSHEVFDRQYHALGEQHRCVGVDLRGHGHSPKPAGEYSYAHHCADLERLFERLDLRDVVLVGWSMGGAVAAQFAAASDRVGKLVMVGAPPRFMAEEGAPYGLPPAACEAFMQAILARREQTLWRTVEDTLAVELGEATKRWLLQLSLHTPTHACVRTYAGVLAADIRPQLETMRVPTLLLHGVHDVFISVEAARWAATVIPDVRLVEFEQSGHAPFLEEPERFTRELAGFAAPKGAS